MAALLRRFDPTAVGSRARTEPSEYWAPPQLQACASTFGAGPAGNTIEGKSADSARGRLRAAGPERERWWEGAVNAGLLPAEAEKWRLGLERDHDCTSPSMVRVLSHGARKARARAH